MNSLDQFAEDKVAQLTARQQRRSLKTQRRSDSTHIVRADKTFVSFSCNDMLGLSHHPAVVSAAQRQIAIEGAGAGASRLVTASSQCVSRLEASLSRFRGTERTLVFGSGSLTNLGVIPSVVGPEDLVVLDERAHASLFAGSRLSRATTRTFAHNDVDALHRLLKAHRGDHSRVLIAVEGVYSMDGDLAPLPSIVALCEQFDAWLLVDDAHAFGVLGGGRGSVAHFGLPRESVPLYVATLSKALGSTGGLVGTSEVVHSLLVSRARTFVYTTGIAPAAAAAAEAALDVIESDPLRVERPKELARRFAERVGAPAPDAHLVPLVIGGERAALEAQHALEQTGYLVTAIRPPTVAPGTSRLRVSFSAAHQDGDVDGLAHAWNALQLKFAQPATGHDDTRPVTEQ